MTKSKTDEKRIPDDLIDQLLANYEKPEDLTGETGILKQLTARLVERAMQAEMTEHLGYEKHAPEGRSLPNSRNGSRTKTLKTDQGEVEIEVPRDRDQDPLLGSAPPREEVGTLALELERGARTVRRFLPRTHPGPVRP